MNVVILSGRFTRDPEIRYSKSGSDEICIAKGTLAVDRQGKKEDGKQSADFPTVTAFRKTAEFIEKYCKQGTKVNVRGRLQTGSYTDREGRRVYTTDVLIEEIEFGEKKGDGAAPADKQKTAAADGDGFMQIPDGADEDGLPFN